MLCMVIMTSPFQLKREEFQFCMEKTRKIMDLQKEIWGGYGRKTNYWGWEVYKYKSCRAS